jgi:ribose transport system permease protein
MATNSQTMTSSALQRPRTRDDSRRQRLSWFSRPAGWVGLVDLVLIAVFSIASTNHVFFSVANFTNMALDSSQTVLLAVGVAMLLSAGEIDISLGANIVLSSVLGAKATVAVAGAASTALTPTYPHLALGLAVGVLVAVATGTTFGLVNGLLVTRLRINSFISTLATLGIGAGIALVVTKGSNVAGIPIQMQSGFGVYKVFGFLPAPALVTAVIAAVIWFVLVKTRYGLRSLALGSSREAAVRAGLKTRGHLISLFCVAGAASGIAGVMDYSRFGTTNVGGHETAALAAIAGVVIGGGALFGGRVSIPGAVLGALLAVILETGLVILGLDPFYQQIAIGVVLLFAVYLRSRGDAVAGDDHRPRRRLRLGTVTNSPERDHPTKENQ